MLNSFIIIKDGLIFTDNIQTVGTKFWIHPCWWGMIAINANKLWWIEWPYSTKIRELWGNPPPLPSRFPSTPYLPRFDGAWIGYNKLLLSAVYGLYIVYLYTFNVNCHHSWRGEYPAVLLSICFAKLVLHCWRAAKRPLANILEKLSRKT